MSDDESLAGAVSFAPEFASGSLSGQARRGAHNPTCNGPIVHVHANALLTGSGATSIVLADLREPEVILTHPKTRALIDFGQPVALLLVAILHFIDTESPARIVATLRDALPPGSYLILSHATGDLRPDAAQSAADVHNGATSSVTLRNKAQVEALFDGWELIEPGVVQVPLWRPEGKLGVWTGESSGSRTSTALRAPSVGSGGCRRTR
jgi:hypothetical protein